MENRKFIYVFGLLFSAVFALLYYGLFHVLLDTESTSVQLYYNQVGLYKNTENAQNVIKQLKAKNVDAYIYQQNGLNAVICGISASQADTKKNGEALKKTGLDYIEKQWTSEQQEILQALQDNNITKVLEMMNNESKRNEQAGTPS